MANLSVNIGGLELSNPVMTASGTFGYGEEFTPFIDIDRLGAYIIKSSSGQRLSAHGRDTGRHA